MKPLMIFGVVVLVALVLCGGCAMMGYQGYNNAIRMDEAVKNRWSEVDNQLQRRYDLIPNLEATVKGTAKQEKDVFLGIANARKAYFQADNVNDKARAASQMETALSRLLFLQETYPELKSNQAFLKLQDQLEGTENRLTVARENYNEAVQNSEYLYPDLPRQLVGPARRGSRSRVFQDRSGGPHGAESRFLRQASR